MSFNYLKSLLLFNLIAICILLANPHKAMPQSYPFRHFTIKDGLPCSEIYHVFQDSKGYIWFATNNGVSRYDGYEFKNFSKKDGLPDVTVFEIYEDFKHRIWFIPHSGMLSYFLNDSIFEYEYNAILQSNLKKTMDPLKLSFFVDSSNSVFYCDKKNGSFSIDSSGNIQKLNPNNFIIKSDRVISTGLKPVPSGSSYLITFNIEKGGKLFYTKSEVIDNRTQVSALKEYFAINKNNNIFISGYHKIYQITNYLNIFEKKSLRGITWLSVDKNNNLWIGTHGGVMGYASLNVTQKPKFHFLKEEAVSSVLHDREGGYWFSTLDNGVYYLPNLNTRTLSVNQDLFISDIKAITSDSINIWLGLKNQVLGLNNDSIHTRIKLESNNDAMNKLHYDNKNDRLLIAATKFCYYQGGHIHQFYFKNFQGQITPLTGKYFHVSSSDIIWITYSYGLGRYYEDKKILNQSVISQRFYTIQEVKSMPYFLCGCHNGLWEYSINKDSFNYLGNKNELLRNQINCITHNEYHSNYWLGTKTNGIVVYDKDSIYNINVSEGLSDNFITSFFSKNNIIWAATKNGLNKISLQETNSYNYKIEVLNKNNGIISNEINDIYVNDSMVYLATKEGLSIIDYKNLELNKYPPKVYIKSVEILDKDTILKPHYDLTYQQNTIHIEYVGLMYKNLGEKKYKYQLIQKGKRGTWKETNENNIRLSFLPPGEYVFKVKAINENNVESAEAAYLGFTIMHPYWKTWWFIGMTIIFALSVLFILYMLRIREINKRNKLEKKMMQQINKYRQQALSQQMNPHFIFNTLNSIQYYIYNNDNLSSTKYLAKFSRLMRLILDNSQHDSIPIQNELDAMELYLELESLRLEKSIKHSIVVNNNLDTNLYHIFPLLLQPYIENAIWHGLVHKEGLKKLKIELSLNSEVILCIIEDNGIGRKKAMEIKNQKKQSYNSHGTNITSKRIDVVNKLYNCKFEVETIDLKNSKEDSCGTRVVIRIPKDLN